MCEQPKVLYEGCKTYWKVRTTLDVTFVDHQHTVEIIAYDPQYRTEAPRLYVDSALAAKSLNAANLQAKLQEEKEKLLRLKATCDEQALKDQITEEMLKDFLLSRLQVRGPAGGDQPWDTYLQPNFCDTVDPDTGLMTIMLPAAPADLAPLAIPRAAADPRKWDATIQQFQQLVTGAHVPARRPSLVPLIPLFIPDRSPSKEAVTSTSRNQCWAAEVSVPTAAAPIQPKVLNRQPSQDDMTMDATTSRQMPKTLSRKKSFTDECMDYSGQGPSSRAVRALTLAKQILAAQDDEGELLFLDSSVRPSTAIPFHGKLVRSATCAHEHDLSLTSNESSPASTPDSKPLFVRSATCSSRLPQVQVQGVAGTRARGTAPRRSDRLDRAVFKTPVINGADGLNCPSPMNSARSPERSPRCTSTPSPARIVFNAPHCADSPTISSGQKFRHGSTPSSTSVRRMSPAVIR